MPERLFGGAMSCNPVVSSTGSPALVFGGIPLSDVTERGEAVK
jgi:hypothetical protein